MRPGEIAELERSRRFWQAGLIYGALGLAIMAVVLGDPQMLRPERRADLFRLLVGLPVFALVAVSIPYGDRGLAWMLSLIGVGQARARRVGRRSQSWLVRLLTVISFVRFVVFLGNALGYRLNLRGVETTSMNSDVSMWLPAAMMSAIVIMLFRAGWYRPVSDNSGKVTMSDLNFETDVLERSRSVPIVVDFWAPWCGPCRILGPIIEKLADEAEGRWKLVKLDTEKYPELAARYEIRGIPAVKMFHGGEVIAEFLGALPADEIREWLSSNLPSQGG